MAQLAIISLKYTALKCVIRYETFLIEMPILPYSVHSDVLQMVDNYFKYEILHNMIISSMKSL